MDISGKTIGFAITGSFCTFSKVFPNVVKLIDEGAEVVPIMSEICYKTDTRFGTAEEHISFLENVTGKKVISQIKEVEPIGPRKMLDVLVVAPCTGNSLAKIATGIADSSVTLAVKSHLRNKRPVVIAISTKIFAILRIRKEKLVKSRVSKLILFSIFRGISEKFNLKSTI